MAAPGVMTSIRKVRFPKDHIASDPIGGQQLFVAGVLRRMRDTTGHLSDFPVLPQEEDPHMAHKPRDVTGTVVAIMRYSISDGAGIRTTVFFKGCPLRCRWCHNPESISPRKEIIYRQDRCLGCGDCVRACPHDAIDGEGGRYAPRRDRCLRCGSCAGACVAEAREVVGKEMAVAEVMEEIEKDVVFYDESGGGVTCSGGEPLLQHEFLLELLRACKRKGIHTVVDTSGFAHSDIVLAASRYTDAFLYDVKTLDEQKHKQFTGVSNSLILANLELLAREKKDITIRVPLIPGFNDTPEELVAVGRLAVSLGTVGEISLLPFHGAGIEKYERLGMEYTMPELVPHSAETLRKLAGALSTCGFTVKIGG